MVKNSDPVELLRLLRVGGGRRREDAGGDDGRDEPHRITSSARRSTLGGIATPMTSTLSRTNSTASAGNRSMSPFGESVLDCDVASLDVPELAQPLAKCFSPSAVTRGRQRREVAYAGDLRLLGVRREQRREEGERQSGDDELTQSKILHSITSSARASTLGGIVSPSPFAVLRLITSSNFVGCSTGRSAGFAPFRILST